MAIQIKRAHTTAAATKSLSLLEGQLGYDYEAKEMRIGRIGGVMG